MPRRCRRGHAANPGKGRASVIPLLGLAPDGVCLDLRCYHRSGALLPHLFTLTTTQRRGGMFLWRCPSGRPAPPLAGILPGGARTFLYPAITTEQRPPGLLDTSNCITDGRRALVSDIRQARSAHRLSRRARQSLRCAKAGKPADPRMSANPNSRWFPEHPTACPSSPRRFAHCPAA